jgi:hypothetical protein
MKWLLELQINRAAKRYASQLPPVLAQNWGASKTYTAGQLEAGVKMARLNRRFIALAYAAYLPEENYNQAKAGLPLMLSYGGARSTFQQYASWAIDRPWDPAPSMGDADWGSSPDYNTSGHAGGGHH